MFNVDRNEICILQYKWKLVPQIRLQLAVTAIVERGSIVECILVFELCNSPVECQQPELQWIIGAADIILANLLERSAEKNMFHIARFSACHLLIYAIRWYTQSSLLFSHFLQWRRNSSMVLKIHMGLVFSLRILSCSICFFIVNGIALCQDRTEFNAFIVRDKLQGFLQDFVYDKLLDISRNVIVKCSYNITNT